jgi:hypothetical protein
MTSVYTDEECKALAPALLETYFAALGQALSEYRPTADFEAIKLEWAELYAFAWADFTRFLLGWMPTHHKLTDYAHQQVAIALAQLQK